MIKEILEVLKPKVEEFSARISFFEIYLSKINDLLSNQTDLKIGLDIDKLPIIRELAEYQIQTFQDVIGLLSKGKHTRKTRSTIFNNLSSRSHLILRLNINFKKGQEEREVAINFCDLAGSERFSDEKTTDHEILRESTSINQSLTNLGRVIRALEKRSKIGVIKLIPYRDDPLTMILQRQLEKNGKIMILTAFSPSEYFIYFLIT